MEPRLDAALREIRRLAGEMRANLDFVLTRLPEQAVEDALRARVDGVCRACREALGPDFEAAVGRLERAGDEAPAIIEGLTARLDARLGALDALVRQLFALHGGPPLSLLAVLVGESAAGVMTSHARLREALEFVGAHRARPSGARPQPQRVELPCAVCGERAVAFAVDRHPWQDSGTCLVFEGITRQEAFDLALAPEVFERLERGDVAGVHTLLPEGLDAYCPACDKLYCRTHYAVEESYDDDFEGWYDASYGTCPAGHRRLLDD